MGEKEKEKPHGNQVLVISWFNSIQMQNIIILLPIMVIPIMGKAISDTTVSYIWGWSISNML